MTILSSLLKNYALTSEKISALADLAATPVSPADLRFLVNCITTYARPTNKIDYLSWLAHRVFNAIKSIFGCSDWQSSVKILAKQAYSVRVSRGYTSDNYAKLETLTGDILSHAVEFYENRWEIAGELKTFAQLPQHKDEAAASLKHILDAVITASANAR